MDSHELQIGQNKKKKNTERQLSKLTGYETSFDQGCPVSCRDQIHFGTRHGGTITTKVSSDCCGATWTAGDVETGSYWAHVGTIRLQRHFRQLPQCTITISHPATLGYRDSINKNHINSIKGRNENNRKEEKTQSTCHSPCGLACIDVTAPSIGTEIMRLRSGAGVTWAWALNL